MSDVWQARLDRERRARKEAERLLEDKSLELYLKNQDLAELTSGLEKTVAERTQALTAALAAEREMNQRQRAFISVVSHEFRTPLAVIDGAAQRLLRNAERAGPNDIRDLSRRARTSVGQMTDLIERFLSCALLEDGHIELNLRRVAITELIELACARQRSIAASHAITTDLAAMPTEIDADPRLLDQILANLLSNAVKYSGQSRQVEVVGRTDGDHVEIAVRDYGVGIPAEDVGKLFARFYRASTAKGIPGTGIGLHLVKQLLQLHGGTIRVERAVDQGCIFIARLPIYSRRTACTEVSLLACDQSR
jgi:signal transduction histidine kinase